MERGTEYLRLGLRMETTPALRPLTQWALGVPPNTPKRKRTKC